MTRDTSNSLTRPITTYSPASHVQCDAQVIPITCAVWCAVVGVTLSKVASEASYVCLDWQGHKKCFLLVCHTSQKYNLGRSNLQLTACSVSVQQDPYCSCMIITGKPEGQDTRENSASYKQGYTFCWVAVRSPSRLYMC